MQKGVSRILEANFYFVTDQSKNIPEKSGLLLILLNLE